MRFKIKAGQAAIYDQSTNGDLPLTAPLSYLDDLKWHNELEHIGIVEIRDYTVNLAATNASSYSPPYTNTHVIDTHDQPFEPFVYGYVTLPGGVIRTFSMHAAISRASYPSELAGIKRHAFLRFVSLGVDGSNIVLHEWARDVFWSSGTHHAAMTIGLRVFITDLSLSDLGNPTPAPPNRSFLIEDEDILLGPFDANKRYLHINASGTPQFPLVNGRTMHGGTSEGWAFTVPSPSAFAFSISFGTAPTMSETVATDVSS